MLKQTCQQENKINNTPFWSKGTLIICFFFLICCIATYCIYYQYLVHQHVKLVEQIAEERQQLQEIEERFKELKREIAEAEGTSKKLKEQIEADKNELDKLRQLLVDVGGKVTKEEEKLNKLKKEMEEIERKKRDEQNKPKPEPAIPVPESPVQKCPPCSPCPPQTPEAGSQPDIKHPQTPEKNINRCWTLPKVSLVVVVGIGFLFELIFLLIILCCCWNRLRRCGRVKRSKKEKQERPPMIIESETYNRSMGNRPRERYH